jgi:SAM-dependent methyltransferase
MATSLPYFDELLSRLQEDDVVAKAALGEHVHWGFWEDPNTRSADPLAYHRAAEAMVERVVRHASITDGTRVLDVGCGLGGTLRYLNEKYRDCTFVGINIDERQLKVARRNVTPKNGNTVTFLYGDACALDFPAESFDVILCVESIFHFPDRKKFIEGCAHILKPAGRVVISDLVPLAHLGAPLDLLQRATKLIERAYGTVRINVSVRMYRTCAQAYGLSLLPIDDITVHTLPTYFALRNGIQGVGFAGRFKIATALIEFFTRIGVVRYLVLTMQKVI